ncbi:autophagy protein 5-like [Biomphalaria glabrata]|uniref:Autophagy protein 5 n=1 Tax=Biomphalaria glabrata TaxID=6526 RepID=A0A9U8EA27_BIOGL|nr:autophagy protein 5-like [Biomphalaria glabrata]XP_013078588.2 autophagy protein 5-like [Biomphalaria glabrata]XP_055889689.1 autophagy protein 5-like [Biomphalaria glabrata]
MADDREILRELWDGKIPVSFQLAQEEIYTVEQPDPFFLLVPRLTYFPLVTDKVYRHMVKHVDPDHGEMWLEFDNQPLKWHYPIGVLYDLYGYQSELPWTLTVHFKNFPEDELLHCPSKEAVESHFMSVVKEADALKHRGQAINNMQKKDHKALWTGLMNDKFDQFWSVNKKLMENSGEDAFKSVPFRIYQMDQIPVQKLFKPVDDNGENLTLKNLLSIALPDLEEKGILSRYRVVTQGIEPPLDVPVGWMSEHLSYPDNFLHICLVSRGHSES